MLHAILASLTVLVVGCAGRAPDIDPRDDGGEGEGEGEGGGATLSATPTLNLGSACLGGACRPPVESELVVTNSGDAPSGPITLSIAPEGEFIVASSTCASTLAAGAACTVRVGFEPSDIGSATSTLTIDAAPGGPTTVELAGTGVSCDDIIVLSPAPVSFPDTVVGATSAPVLCTAMNLGALSYEQVTTTLGGVDDADFAIGSNGCAGTTLAPGASCTFEVSFAPTGAGARTATVAVTSPSPCANEALSVLLGTGI